MEINLEEIPIVYRPSEEILKESNLYKIMQEEKLSYEELYKRSIDDEEWFWKRFFKDINFKWFKEPDKIVEKNGINTKWFSGGLLNISSNCLDFKEDKVVVIEVDESGKETILTSKELEAKVNKLSNFLANIGIGVGDVVALYMPLSVESVISFLSLARIGAIVVPLFSGFGKDAINVRLKNCSCKMVISYTHNVRKRKTINMKDILLDSLEGTNVEKILFINKFSEDNLDLSNYGKVKFYFWDEVEKCSPYIKVPYFSSDHPLMIIYTSGTTGLPKGIVHFHSGFPIKSAQDMYHCFDIKENDIFTWITDIGWMMGPWLIYGTLINRATIFIYNGSPDYPDIDVIWSLVEKYNITMVGLSPSYIRSIASFSKVDQKELKSLRMVGSTGEVWDNYHWNWLFEKVCKKEKPIINYSGGTEISGGILCNLPIKPIKPISFNSPVLGIYADVLNDEGVSVKNEVGYLCIRNHNPGLATTFLNDHQRYIDTYWSRFENIWYHGDLAYIDKDGYFYILGRADDILKIAGKRIGPSEYETIINDVDGVKESAVIGIPDEVKGMAPIAFVVLANQESNVDAIKNKILTKVVEMLGKPFALKDVIFVEDLPKTRNFKIMRRLLRDIWVYGQVKGDVSNLVNPESCEKILRLVRR